MFRSRYWLTCAVAALSATLASAQDTARVRRLLSDIRATGLKRVAVLAFGGRLRPAEVEALAQVAAKSGLEVTVRRMDIDAPTSIRDALASVDPTQVDAIMPLASEPGVQAAVAQMQALALGLPALVYQRGDDGSLSLVALDVMPSLQTVLEIKRPQDNDVLLLKNGQPLTGTVRNKCFFVRTPYVHSMRVEVPLAMVAGIAFESERYLDTVVTVNGNKISGFIDGPGLVLELATGSTITIRKETIGKAILRVRPGESASAPRNHVLVLTNGDVLTGKVTNDSFRIKTAYAEVPVPAKDIKHMAMTAGLKATATATLAGDKAPVLGLLVDDDVHVDLDVGTSVKVHKSRLQEVFFQNGYGPSPDLSGLGIEFAFPRVDTADQVVNSIGATLVRIRSGAFKMGSSQGEPDERPLHEVTFAKPFYIGATEVTQEQWESVMGSNPSERKGPSLPVTNVNWEDCQEFCRKLTQRERQSGELPSGAAYRLPTEAEWEYSCRAGSAASFCFGDSEEELTRYAWHKQDSDGRTHDVAGKRPNTWGLHDVHGNVWEWCQDWKGEYANTAATDPQGPSAGSFRILRGGGFGDEARHCRCANRLNNLPRLRLADLGFRVVRSLP